MREAIRDIDRLRHIDECIEHINDYLIIATNATLVWDTYTTDLPLLKKHITQFIEELNK